jgi:hypothetical protein
MPYPSPTTIRSYGGSVPPTYFTTDIPGQYITGQTITVHSLQGWYEVDVNGQITNKPLGTSGPFVITVRPGLDEERILCSAVNIATNVITVWTAGTLNGRGYDGTIIQAHVHSTGSNIPNDVYHGASATENLQFNQGVASAINTANAAYAYVETLLQGPQGPQGPQGQYGGPQGYQGAQGPQGYQGAPSTVQGPQGNQGTQGNQGNQGTQGTQGTQGYQGNQGYQGPQGYQGTGGSTGTQGPQGNQGNQGSQGSTGAQGPQGYQGAFVQGPQGNQGNGGPTGAQGGTGAQGATGSQGATGAQGANGNSFSGLNPQTSSYTFASSDLGGIITINSSSATTVTIPLDSVIGSPSGVGQVVEVISLGIGQATFGAQSGVTIVSTGYVTAAPVIRTRYSSASAIRQSANSWIVVGDII